MWNLWKLMLPLMDAPDLGGGGGGDVSAVISGALEGVDRGGDPGPDPDSEPRAAAPDPSEEGELSVIEKEILAKNPGMANSTIAAHRHQAVLTRNRNQWEKQQQELQAKYDEANQKWERYKWAEDPQIHEGLQLLSLAESDPDQFVEILLSDPRYGKILQRAGAPPEVASPPNPMADRPRPNARSQDGSYDYYDDDGVESLLSWHGQQVQTAAVKQAREELMKEFGPALKDYQTRSMWNEAVDTSKQQLEHARTNWGGFKEYEPKIRQVLLADPNISLHDAYIKVTVPALQEQTRVNRETLRKELLEELRGKPKAVTESTRQVERTAEGGKLSTEDIIRRSIASVRE